MEKKYYSSFIFTFLMMLLIMTCPGFLVTLIVSGGDIAWEHLAFPALAMLVFVLFLTCITVPFFPVIIRPEGISTYNFWGTYRTITWDEIVSIGRFNFLGLRYFTLKTKQHQTLYIPRFLNNFLGFRDQVSSWAGANHLLTEKLCQS